MLSAVHHHPSLGRLSVIAGRLSIPWGLDFYKSVILHTSIDFPDPLAVTQRTESLCHQPVWFLYQVTLVLRFINTATYLAE
jgi:hypothetical protein